LCGLVYNEKDSASVGGDHRVPGGSK